MTTGCRPRRWSTLTLLGIPEGMFWYPAWQQARHQAAGVLRLLARAVDPDREGK